MSIPLTYKKSACFTNAFLNSRHAYKNLGLKLKIGSLGMNGWFEYGGRDWTREDFFRNHKEGSYRFDAHAWLEDEQGNVYDYIFEWYNQVAVFRTGRPLKWRGKIVKMNKRELLKKGLNYKETDPETQKEIFACMKDWLLLVEKGLLRGDVKWIGGGEDCEMVTEGESLKESMRILSPSDYDLIPA